MTGQDKTVLKKEGSTFLRRKETGGREEYCDRGQLRRRKPEKSRREQDGKCREICRRRSE